MLQRTVAVPAWLDPAVVRDGPAWLGPRAPAFPDTAARVDNPGTLGNLVHQDFPVTLERSLAPPVNQATRGSPGHSPAPPVVRDTLAFRERLDTQVTQDHRDIVLLRANPASLGVLDHRVTLGLDFLATLVSAHLDSLVDQVTQAPLGIQAGQVIRDDQVTQDSRVTLVSGSQDHPVNQVSLVTLVKVDILDNLVSQGHSPASQGSRDFQDIRDFQEAEPVVIQV